MRLNEFRYLVRSMLIEGIVEDLKKKYTEPMTRSSIDYFAKNDPSGKNKYIRWMTKQYVEMREMGNREPDYDIINVVKSFHDNPGSFKSKDINSYTYETLRQEMLHIVPSKTTSKKIDKQGAVKVLEVGQFSMYRIDTRRACIQYGMGTKWCVSMANSDDQWNDYTRKSVLYLLVDRKLKTKYMFDYRWTDKSGSVFDATKVFDDNDEEIMWRKNLRSEDQFDGMTNEQEDQIWKTIRDDAKNSPWVRLLTGKMNANEFKNFTEREGVNVASLASSYIVWPKQFSSLRKSYVNAFIELQGSSNPDVAMFAKLCVKNYPSDFF